MRFSSFVAMVALAMLAVKALKVLPSVPFAPGHKLVLLTPLYVVASMRTIGAGHFSSYVCGGNPP